MQEVSMTEHRHVSCQPSRQKSWFPLKYTAPLTSFLSSRLVGLAQNLSSRSVIPFAPNVANGIFKQPNPHMQVSQAANKSPVAATKG